MTEAQARPNGLRFRTILVPHDFSPSASKALNYAMELADADQGVIHLLHVTTSLSVVGPFESALPLLMNRQVRDDHLAAEARLIELSAQSSVPVEVHVGFGAPATIICQVAARLGADLIVMGTHARPGVAGIFHGSAAVRTVRRAPCPVFTVRSHEERQRG